MTKGTIELLSLPNIAQGSTKPYAWYAGSIWGMRHVDKIAISLIGSFNTTGTITASVYAAVARSKGSVAAVAAGTLSVGKTATGVGIRTQTFARLENMPFLAVKVADGGGSYALGPVRVVAHVQYP